MHPVSTASPRKPGPKSLAGNSHQCSGALDVAQALLPAASALLPTLACATLSCPRTGAEMSLGTAGTSACATSAPAKDLRLQGAQRVAHDDALPTQVNQGKVVRLGKVAPLDRKSTRLNSSHRCIS